MRLYLAARYDRRDELKQYAKRLESIGIEVTSRWLDEDKPLNTKIGDDTIEFYRETATQDLEDIERAGSLLFFSEDPLIGVPRGGRNVEYGFALAKRKFIMVIGGHENIFQFLPEIRHFDTFETFYTEMEMYREATL